MIGWVRVGAKWYHEFKIVSRRCGAGVDDGVFSTESGRIVPEGQFMT
jgi:hypothetical protein